MNITKTDNNSVLIKGILHFPFYNYPECQTYSLALAGDAPNCKSGTPDKSVNGFWDIMKDTGQKT